MSDKGGDSSDSASSQTPAQWAAAQSNTSIAAWKENDILSFSVAQLRALTTAQVSQITVPWAIPGAAWTADTLNAVPVQYWGAFGPRYLSTTINGRVTVQTLSQYDGVSSGVASGISNWFGDLGYSYQSSTGSWVFSPSVIAGISNDRIAAIGSGLGTASHAPTLGANNTPVSAQAFESALNAATSSGEHMTTWNISVSSSDQSAGVSKRSVVMFGAGWADMGAVFMSALTSSQLGAIAHPEAVLTAAQFGAFSANQLIALRQMDWSKVTAAQLNAISLEAFSGLQTNIIAAISASAWGGLDQAHTQKLNATDISLLSASSIAALKYLGYALTASVAGVLTASQVAGISDSCWAQLSDTNFLNALPLSVMQSIAPSAFARMSSAVIASMDSLHLGALTNAQSLVFPVNELSNASALFYHNPNTLNFNDFVNNPSVNWGQAPASFIRLLTLAQLKLLQPSQIGQLSLAAIAGFTRSQTQALTLAQIQAWRPAQLSAALYMSRRVDVVADIFTVSTVTQISPAFWGRVDSNFLNALSLDAFRALTTAQIEAISTDAFAGMDQAHFEAFTITQLLALTAAQVGSFRGEYLSIFFLRNIRLVSFKGLVPEQMHRLHDYLFNTVATNAFATADPELLETAEHQFATLLASILESDDGREAWLQQSVNLLIRLNWLDPAAASTLSASDVQSVYSALNWAWMSGTFLNSIMVSVFAQIRATSIAQINLSALAALDSAHIQALTVTQAAGLSGAQLSAISNLGALQASVVQSLTGLQLAGITTDWSTLSSDFLDNMTAWQFAALTPSQFGQLSYAQLSSSPIDWSLLEADAWNAVSLDNFARLCLGENPAVLHITSTAILGLSADHMAILADASQNYNAAQTQVLLKRLFGSFTTTQQKYLLSAMSQDTLQNIVLQIGLVNKLAEIDGTLNGLDTAIQTVLSARQMNPSWFSSAENLTNVLSAIGQSYQDAKLSYKTNLGAINFFQSVFGTASIIGSVAKRYAPSLSAGITATLGLSGRINTHTNNTVLPSILQALGNLFVASDGLTPSNTYIARINSELVKQTRGQLQTELSNATNAAERNAYTKALNIFDEEVGRLLVEVGQQTRRVSYSVGPEFDVTASNSEQVNAFFGGAINTMMNRFNARLLDSVGLDVVAVGNAGQSALAIGSLLVMLGAAANDIGRAIEAPGSLSESERQQLIAAASLGAISYVAQGLALPVTMIMQAIVAKYTGQGYTEQSYSSAILSKFTEGFRTLYSAKRLARNGQVATAANEGGLVNTSGVAQQDGVLPTHELTVRAPELPDAEVLYTLVDRGAIALSRAARSSSPDAPTNFYGVVEHATVSGRLVASNDQLSVKNFTRLNVERAIYQALNASDTEEFRVAFGLADDFDIRYLPPEIENNFAESARAAALKFLENRNIHLDATNPQDQAILQRAIDTITAVHNNEAPNFVVEDVITRIIAENPSASIFNPDGTVRAEGANAVRGFLAKKGYSAGGLLSAQQIADIASGINTEQINSVLSERYAKGLYTPEEFEGTPPELRNFQSQLANDVQRLGLTLPEATKEAFTNRFISDAVQSKVSEIVNNPTTGVQHVVQREATAIEILNRTQTWYKGAARQMTTPEIMDRVQLQFSQQAIEENLNPAQVFERILSQINASPDIKLFFQGPDGAIPNPELNVHDIYFKVLYDPKTGVYPQRLNEVVNTWKTGVTQKLQQATTTKGSNLSLEENAAIWKTGLRELQQKLTTFDGEWQVEMTLPQNSALTPSEFKITNAYEANPLKIDTFLNNVKLGVARDVGGGFAAEAVHGVNFDALTLEGVNAISANNGNIAKRFVQALGESPSNPAFAKVIQDIGTVNPTLRSRALAQAGRAAPNLEVAIGASNGSLTRGNVSQTDTRSVGQNFLDNVAVRLAAQANRPESAGGKQYSNYIGLDGQAKKHFGVSLDQYLVDEILDGVKGRATEQQKFDEVLLGAMKDLVGAVTESGGNPLDLALTVDSQMIVESVEKALTLQGFEITRDTIIQNTPALKRVDAAVVSASLNEKAQAAQLKVISDVVENLPRNGAQPAPVAESDAIRSAGITLDSAQVVVEIVAPQVVVTATSGPINSGAENTQGLVLERAVTPATERVVVLNNPIEKGQNFSDAIVELVYTRNITNSLRDTEQNVGELTVNFLLDIQDVVEGKSTEALEVREQIWGELNGVAEGTNALGADGEVLQKFSITDDMIYRSITKTLGKKLGYIVSTDQVRNAANEGVGGEPLNVSELGRGLTGIVLAPAPTEDIPPPLPPRLELDIAVGEAAPLEPVVLQAAQAPQPDINPVRTLGEVAAVRPEDVVVLEREALGTGARQAQGADTGRAGPLDFLSTVDTVAGRQARDAEIRLIEQQIAAEGNYAFVDNTTAEVSRAQALKRAGGYETEDDIATQRLSEVDAARNIDEAAVPRAKPLGANEAGPSLVTVETAKQKFTRLSLAGQGFAQLGFALFASIVGIAAGIAGIIYAAQSKTLSSSAKILTITMNVVRVFTSVTILVGSGAQIVSSVVKAVSIAADVTKIAEASFAIGNVVGIATSAAQLLLQVKDISTGHTTGRAQVIEGLAILDTTIQFLLAIAGTVALAFGPIGIAISVIILLVATLIPSAAAITSAITYHESYTSLKGQGLYNEAQVMFVYYQSAALDATPIVNWTSSIYTPEIKKAQEKLMDYAWMDQSAEQRLFYSITSNSAFKDNFDGVRDQTYAAAAALTQPLVNLSQGLTRAVTLMLSQDNLSYFEGDKVATVKLAATSNYLTNTVVRAPKLINATVSGTTVTLTFNQNLASLNSQLPDLSTFTVRVNGVVATLKGFALSGNTATLVLNTAVTAGQVVTFSYSDPTAGDDQHALQAITGKDFASVSNHAVINLLDTDTRAPQLVDAVVQDKYLTLVFDEVLNSTSDHAPTAGEFTVSLTDANGTVTTPQILGINVSDYRVLLTLVNSVASGDVVSVTYTPAASGTKLLQDTANNKVAGFTSGSAGVVSVVNTAAVSTIVASRAGWLQYDNFVSSLQGTGTEAASVLNGSDYTVYASESAASSGTARLRYLSLSNMAGEFDMYAASRTNTTNDTIWLDASSALGTVSFAVNVNDMTVWGGQGYNSYSLSRSYANSANRIVAANSWSANSNIVSIAGSSSDSNMTVNLDNLLTTENISAGLPAGQSVFKVLGANDGLDVVVGTADSQSYFATTNVANINLSGANANVLVGEASQVKVGVNGRVQVDMDMWRGLSLPAPTIPSSGTTGVVTGGYGSYSLLNFAATDSIDTSFEGKLDMIYQIGHLPALDAWTVNVGGALVNVASMKVSGNKVTLNLASAVQQNQTVSVGYKDLSTDNDLETLQDLVGNDVASFSAQAVVNVTADTKPPALVVATAQGNSLILHFSEILNQAYKPLSADFSVTVNNVAVTVNKVAFDDNSSLRLTLNSAVPAGQTVSVAYTQSSIAALGAQDLAGNALNSFTAAPVINLANVTQAPNLRSVTANGNVLTLSFDSTVRYTLSDASAFLVTVNNAPVSVSSVSVAGNSVLLYLSSAVTNNQLVEVSYTPPQQMSDATTLRDWLGNSVSGWGTQVANNISGEDLTPPTLQYAIANGNSVVLTFSEALDSRAGFIASANVFAVQVNTQAVLVTQVAVSGASVTLSLASTINYGDAVTLAYTDVSTANDVAVVQDLAGNDAASFSGINVVNNSPDTTPPTLVSATVTDNQLALVFSESLNTVSGYLPALTSIAVHVNGALVSVVAGSVNGSVATLTLGKAANAGDYVIFNYTQPSTANATQAFQDLAGNDLLSIANFGVTNLTGVDSTAPSLKSAQASGNIVTLTFSEALRSTANFTPSASAFSVYVDGTQGLVSAVSVNGTQVLLTLATAVNSGQAVAVSYTQPTSQAIQDGAANMTASFNRAIVKNVTVDTIAPSLSTATVAGALLTLTFSENLASDPSLMPSASEFSVKVDGHVADLLGTVVQNNTLAITLSQVVRPGQVVSVDYTPSATGTNNLQDTANNKTAKFSQNVLNWSGIASIQNANINASHLTMTFNQLLDGASGHVPPLSAFTVKVNGVTMAVSQLVVQGYTATLTLGKAVTAGQTVTVSYTDPSSGDDVLALQNLAGLDVQTFSAPYAVHNLTPAVVDYTPPSLSSAVVNGSALTLTFSEALDAGVGEWLVNYLPNNRYDDNGKPLVTSSLLATGFVNVLGSNGNDNIVINDQSGLATAQQLSYVQLGNGQGVQVSSYDTSGNLLLALGSTGQANVILESGSSLQKLFTNKLVQSDSDVTTYKANRDTVTLRSLSSLTAFLSGYETIDATDSTSSLTAEIGSGDHQIKLGGQTVHLQFDKVASNTVITTRQIPNSWLDYQYFNFNGINADGLWVGRESNGKVLFQAQWTDATTSANDILNVSYDGTLSNVVFEVGKVLASEASSQLRLDKLIEIMATPAFSSDPNAAGHAMTVTDPNNGVTQKLYRITDIVAYSSAPQATLSGGV